MPFKVSVGKNAARATPIDSFAAAVSRSAAAISGRRSSKVDGTPGGKVGISIGLVVTGIENVDAGWPISVAMACS